MFIFSAHKLHHLLSLKQTQLRKQCNFKLWKMCTNHDRIYSIHVQSVELLYVVFFFSKGQFIWHKIVFQLQRIKLLRISRCKFEYFSVNNQYTSKRLECNETNHKKPAHSWKYRHQQQSTYSWEVSSADLFAIFKAIYWGNCMWFNLPRLTAPFIGGTLFGSANSN